MAIRRGQDSPQRREIALPPSSRTSRGNPIPFPDVTIVAVHCGRCGQGLVDLLRIPREPPLSAHSSNPPSMFFQPPPVASANDLYIERNEVHGWRWDGNTLRPTRYHLEQQQRAREEVWAKPRTETKRHPAKPGAPLTRTPQELLHSTAGQAGRSVDSVRKRGSSLSWRRNGSNVRNVVPMFALAPTLAAHDDVM